MEMRPLGRTGVKVSSLCLGCMMFGGKTTPQDSYAIIDRGLDAGINFLDTANVYSIGKSEEVTGEALKRNGKRNSTVLATKVHGVMGPGENENGNSRRHIIEQCEQSLRRLQTDWIDLYQIHRPQSDIPIDETLRAMDDLIRSGKVRYIGASTFGAWQLVESFWVSKELGLNRFICEQPPYHILDRRIERELVPMAQTYGMAIIPWSPLAGGMLGGILQKKDKGRTAGKGADERLARIRPQIEAWENFCKALGEHPADVALAWTLHHPAVTAPIIGPRTMEQLIGSVRAVEIKLGDEQLKALDRIFPGPKGATPEGTSDWNKQIAPEAYAW